MAASVPDPGVAVLTLQGDNDASVAHRVQRDLVAAVNGEAPVVVDLTGATSLDAAVVRILLDGLAESERCEHVLLLLLPEDDDSPVRRLFQISGLVYMDSCAPRHRRAGATHQSQPSLLRCSYENTRPAARNRYSPQSHRGHRGRGRALRARGIGALQSFFPSRLRAAQAPLRPL